MNAGSLTKVATTVILILVLALGSLMVYNQVYKANVSEIYIHMNGHAFENHTAEEVNGGFNCLQKNGSKVVMSEKLSRRLHWICIDPITLTLYDVITTFLTKTIEHPQGEADLVTAYIPKLGESSDITSFYVSKLGAAKEAIIVGLRAYPGNFFVGP